MTVFLRSTHPGVRRRAPPDEVYLSSVHLARSEEDEAVDICITTDAVLIGEYRIALADVPALRQLLEIAAFAALGLRHE